MTRPNSGWSDSRWIGRIFYPPTRKSAPTTAQGAADPRRQRAPTPDRAAEAPHESTIGVDLNGDDSPDGPDSGPAGISQSGPASTARRKNDRPARIIAVVALALALAGPAAPRAGAATSSLFVGRTTDGTALAALTREGLVATAWVISGTTAWPVLRGTLLGTTAALTGARTSGQVTFTRTGASLRLGAGSSAQTVTLVPAGPGVGLLRARSRSGAVEAVGILRSFRLHVAVSGATTAQTAATPVIRTVVAASSLVALPDELLRNPPSDQEKLEQRIREIECATLAIALKQLKLQAPFSELARVRSAIEQKFNLELTRDSAPVPLFTTRTQEIREVVDSVAAEFNEANLARRIAEIRARMEALGCAASSTG